MFALVTGGGRGFLGRHIVDQLLQRGDRVRVLSRSETPDLVAQGVECHVGDIRDPAVVERACVGVDAVFHTAALPGIWGRWDTFHSINTVGTDHVIAGCRRAGVGKLIYTSSPSVVYDGTPHVMADESLPYPETYLCAYPHTKALAERAVLAANVPGTLLTISLRPHLIWGPRDNHLIPRLIQRAKSAQLRQVGDGTNEISMAYVENVAAAHWQACDALSDSARCAGRAYFINESHPVRLWDWVNQLLSIAGLPRVRKQISARAACAIGSGLEFVYRSLGIESEPRMTRFLAAQLSQSHSYCIAAAERDFGYRPLVTVDEGLRRIEPELRKLSGL
jgi:nucleoside-diphosphate-sugar epimerase